MLFCKPLFPELVLKSESVTEGPSPTTNSRWAEGATTLRTTAVPSVTSKAYPISTSARIASTPMYITTAPLPRPTTPKLWVTKAEKYVTIARKGGRITATLRPVVSQWKPTTDWHHELVDIFNSKGRSYPMNKPRLSTTTQPRRKNPKSGRKSTDTKSNSTKLGKKKIHKKQKVKSMSKRIKHGTVRLVNVDNLPDRGRLEIHVNGEWGTVCNDRFDSQAGAVVCQQLGYPFVLKIARRAEFGEGKGMKVLLDEVRCEGGESSLLECRRSKIGEHDCTHEEDVGVVCGMEEEDEEEQLS
ncbi:hypothetical protein FKM82_020752 [Ascaphus truei]